MCMVPKKYKCTEGQIAAYWLLEIKPGWPYPMPRSLVQRNKQHRDNLELTFQKVVRMKLLLLMRERAQGPHAGFPRQKALNLLPNGFWVRLPYRGYCHPPQINDLYFNSLIGAKLLIRKTHLLSFGKNCTYYSGHSINGKFGNDKSLFL